MNQESSSWCHVISVLRERTARIRIQSLTVFVLMTSVAACQFGKNAPDFVDTDEPAGGVGQNPTTNGRCNLGLTLCNAVCAQACGVSETPNAMTPRNETMPATSATMADGGVQEQSSDGGVDAGARVFDAALARDASLPPDAATPNGIADTVVFEGTGTFAVDYVVSRPGGFPEPVCPTANIPMERTA